MYTTKVAVWDVRLDKNGNSRLTVKVPKPNGSNAVASRQLEAGQHRDTFAHVLATNLMQEVYPHTAEHGHCHVDACDVPGHTGGFAFKVF